MLGEEEVTPAVQKEKRIAPVQRQDAAERLSANQQIEQIKQLLSEGKKKEAIAAFESFRQRYPDYKLDPELEKRLD
jgi:outer membrane protein assembly factor BamD (BamD/ComL family)